jgi:hypothetical protein
VNCSSVTGKFALSATDLSGVDVLEYRIDRQAFKPYTDPIKLTLTGRQPFGIPGQRSPGNTASETLYFQGVSIGK